MRSFISRSLRVLALLSAIAAPSVAMAGTWAVGKDPLGPGFVVSDDDPKTADVHTNTERAAKKIARILNKATSFVDPGSGPCHNPAPGTQC